MSDEPYRYDPATMRRQIVQDWLDALGLNRPPVKYEEIDRWFREFEQADQRRTQRRT